ncbi:hypothetical protein P153DRAFT_261989, partial [Dothidotthia symphoricarpi CBS 119687]
LFNNPHLSDVTIGQTSNGVTKEYYGHKTAFSLQSDFFMKAFNGGFKEVSEDIIELHNDSPMHFMIMLKYLYTL